MELTKRQMDIIEAAIVIIARQGYKELTTKNLARSLNLTESALYRHFVSKAELILAILNYFEGLSGEVISKIKAQRLSAMQRIHQFVLNRYRMFTANPDLGKVLFSEEMFRNDPSLSDHLQKIMRCHRDAVIGYIKAAQEDGTIDKMLDPMDLFRIIVGSMRFIVSQWNLCGQDFDLEQEGEKLFNTIKRLIEVKP